MDLIISLYVAILFFILTPSVLLRLPPKGSIVVVAALHAVVFALIYYFTHKIVWKLSIRWMNPTEGFREGYKFGQYVCGAPAHPCPDNKFCIDRTCKSNPDF